MAVALDAVGHRLSVELGMVTRDLGTLSEVFWVCFPLLQKYIRWLVSIATIEDLREEKSSLLHESIKGIIAEQKDEYPYRMDGCGAHCRHYESEIGFIFGDLVWPKHQCLREHTFYPAARELLDFEDFVQSIVNVDGACLWLISTMQPSPQKSPAGSILLMSDSEASIPKKTGNCKAISAIECQRLRCLKKERQISPSPTQRLNFAQPMAKGKDENPCRQPLF